MTTNGTTAEMFEKPLLVLMDGHALVRRAWHAMQEPLNVSSTNEEVTAVYGFLNTFLRALSEWKPTHCVMTFDVSGPTFRHLEYDEYKAHRPPMPPELRTQFDRVRELMGTFGVPIHEMKGFEADDVLGTLAKQAEEQQIETLILTGDSDILQLVSPWVRVVLAYGVQNSKVYDELAVKERYGGLGPELVADIKALQGDTSDNIPGVPRVGAKTAIKLLSQFGSVEGIYDHLDEVAPAGIQKSLRENADVAAQCKMLTTIRRDVPLSLDLDEAKFWNYDRSNVVNLLRELEFSSMVSRIPSPKGDGEQLGFAIEEDDEVEKMPTDYNTVTTKQALDDMVNELTKTGQFSFDTETTSLNPMIAELVGLSFSNAPGKAWYVPVGHAEGEQVPIDKALDTLRPLFANESIEKSAHNANYDVTVLENHDVHVKGLTFDTMLAAHLGGSKGIGLKALSSTLLQEEMTPISELIGTGKKQITMDKVNIDKAAPYAAANADFTQRLLAIFTADVEAKGIRDIFDTVEMPLVDVLVRMQRNGVALDSAMLNEMSVDLGEQLDGIEAGMFDLVGHEFNMNSSQQLGDVLFNELRLPHTKKTKHGYSTDAASLDFLKTLLDEGKAENVDPKAYGVLNRILEYRQLSKIKSTYVDSLPTLVNPKTNRIHTSYNQTGSATGRISSNDPNVQNIPVRTELGRKVRNAFVAEHAPDWTMLAADYSQIELRVLAHFSKDPGLLKAFHNGEDIHSATASSVYSVGMDEVTPDMRRVAKIMNFGVLYGLSAFGIAQQTDLAPDEGAKFIETYFGKYPGIRDYIDGVKEEVRNRGYVETLLGRRRYIPEIRSSSFHVRAAAERMAVNMPIQGTAADIIKLAMIRIQERLDDLKMRSLMILQVHDELIFESPQEELEQMTSIVKELMPAAMSLAVPLDVETKTGFNWGDME